MNEDRYREALEQIRERCGAVCPEYEVCTHHWCASSYTAWALACEALGVPGHGHEEALTAEELSRVYVSHAEECPSHSVFPAQCNCGHQELKAKVRAALRSAGLLASPEEELKACTVCDTRTDRLYGGEGKYPAQCWGCWQGRSVLASPPSGEAIEGAKRAIDEATGPGGLTDDELEFYARTALEGSGLLAPLSGHGELTAEEADALLDRCDGYHQGCLGPAFQSAQAKLRAVARGASPEGHGEKNDG